MYFFHSNTSNHEHTRTHSLFTLLHHRNFFEKRVAEYQKANVMSSITKSSTSDIMNMNEFSLEADF